MNAPHTRLRSPNWRTGAIATTANEVQIQRFRVEVVSGPNRGQSASADAEELGIGSAPTNQLILTDSTVSRYHLSIAATSEGFQLRDLGSANGTYLAGYRVEVAYIESGALIQAGDTTIRFDALEERLSQPLSEKASFGAVIGQSAAMRRMFAALGQVASTETTILFDGESGTGKRALAEAVHQESGRAAGPFVALDCGAISPAAIESELFGHERGAFTGADEDRAGAFAAADGGTLFLDHVGELGPDLQSKLLRALESRQIRRLGSVTPVPVDVRVIAATNRDLRYEVNAGTFRTDLFYRLSGARVTVPALRERRDDIPVLAAHFFREIGSGQSDPPAELISSLLRQPWAGNVRELRSAVERAVAVGQPAANEQAVQPESPRTEAWPDLNFTISFRESKEGALAVWTRVYVRELVDKYGGNLSRAARAVSMDRNHLRDLLHKYAMNNAGPNHGTGQDSAEQP